MQKAYGRGSMGQLLSGLRRQMDAAARRRVDNERHLVTKQHQQLSRLVQTGTGLPPKYTTFDLCSCSSTQAKRGTVETDADTNSVENNSRLNDWFPDESCLSSPSGFSSSFWRKRTLGEVVCPYCCPWNTKETPRKHILTMASCIFLRQVKCAL